MREAIAFVADVPQDSFDIEVIPVLPDEFDTEFAEAERLRAESAWANTTAAEHARRAARLPGRALGEGPRLQFSPPKVCRYVTSARSWAFHISVLTNSSTPRPISLSRLGR